MVSLAVQDGTEELLTVVRDFAGSRVRARAAESEDATATPPGLASELHGMGVAPAIAEEFGGQGVPGAVDSLLVTERLAYGDAGIALELLSSNQAAALIAATGNAEQRRLYLSRFAAEPELVANVLYYEGFGRGPSELETRAVKSGSDWTVSGRKTTVVRHGDADLSVLVARTDTGDLTAFVLEPEQLTRLTVARDDQVTGKLGLRAARTGIAELPGVTVPESQRLVAEHPLALSRAVALFRLQIAALALGVGTASLDYAHAYTSDRIAFGKPVIKYQGVAFPLADSAMTLDAARLDVIALVADLELLDNAAEIERRTTLVVQRTARTALDTTRIGVNSLGGHGYLKDHPVERWYRAATTLSAVDFDPLALDSDVI
jgi:alkylation response protein AidB-like acyl-CoA dehydrogenase